MSRKSNSLLLKLLAIGGLTLVIFLALLLVEGVISSRQSYRDQAVSSISQSYAGAQRLLGPVLVQPYRQTLPHETLDSKGIRQTEMVSTDGTYTVFPDTLTVTGTANPSIRRHGLYKVPVFELAANVAAHFTVPASPVQGGKIELGLPYLAFMISDARGIVGSPLLHAAGQVYPVIGGTLSAEETQNAVHPSLPFPANLRAVLPQLATQPKEFDVNLQLTFGGTEKLDLVPLGTLNHFELASSWKSPLFAGQFLPRTTGLTPAGFHAVWEIPSLATNAQRVLTQPDQHVDTVSVSLTDLVDPYTLADRAVKYGILFVLLTFGAFFLFEMLKRMRIHPLQYLLVGFCLAVFFLLLVSFSERIAFGPAYLISAAACIGILTYYLVFVLRSRVYGLSFGAMLTTLYAAIYGLLVSEDNALLLGSVLLFVVLAGAMIITRKIDWYARTTDDPEALPSETA